MRNFKALNRQSGLALIVGLLLLFVMTLLAVASYTSAHIQERSANNIRLQARAFEAASAGASNAINFFLENKDSLTWPPGVTGDDLCGSLLHPGWEPTNWFPSDDACAGWEIGSDDSGSARLQQRLYCIADAFGCDSDPDPDCDPNIRPPRSQLFVHSRGSFCNNDGIVLAERDVEVRIDIGNQWITGDGCGAICFPGCEHLPVGKDGLDFPSSNVFQVDGAEGPAITTGCAGFTDDVLTAIGENRLANYTGNVQTSPAGSPWNDPETTAQFRDEVRTAAIAAETNSDCSTTCYHNGFYEDNGNTVYGTREDPQILFIDGDAEFGGDISGAGILFVTGTLSWNGTPNWHGLMVALGGNFAIDGGGQGGNPGSKETVVSGGSVVILNLDDPTQTAHGGDESFGAVGFQNTGGGNALYRYDCDMLQFARSELLGVDSVAGGLWDPGCERGPQTYKLAGPQELVIKSWRENFGWREEHWTY